MEDAIKQEINNQSELPKEQQENTAQESSEQEETILNETEKRIKELEEKIAELEKSNNELKDAFLRKAAEFENYKRRTENDQLNIIKYAAEPFIKNILTIYDDLERSLNHITDDNNFESLKKGLELIYDKFTKILDSHGVRKIDAVGQPFDVELHEALMQKPAADVPPHTVLEILEHGYIYKDKVIRHAKVIVSSEITQEENKSEENKPDENNINSTNNN
ncbi:nucleotide exchange factor GrpE [Rosettibacter firmus]|uniref:nucleotide exchange factor GrpE n=1 Tax=Rosettibacter firmus TaxID=3111522 RepID=UPI00336BAF48